MIHLPVNVPTTPHIYDVRVHVSTVVYCMHMHAVIQNKSSLPPCGVLELAQRRKLITIKIEVNEMIVTRVKYSETCF